MAKFEEPIRMDLIGSAQVFSENQTLELPWYLRIGINQDVSFNSTDAEGRHYTKIVYSLPEVFESAEMDCVVCWDTETVAAFIGDSRAMWVIDEEFPELQWK